MKPICVRCQRFYRPKKNGFNFVEGMPKEGSPGRGLDEPEKWKPYKLWQGDLWQCAGCGSQVVIGVGNAPLAEHFQPDFAAKVVSFGADLQVNDC